MAAVSCLRAKIFGIEFPKKAHDLDEKFRIAGLYTFKQKDYKPSDKEAKLISQQVDNIDPIEDQIPKEKPKGIDNKEDLIKQFKELKAKIKNPKKFIFPEEFEKDNDKNFHIDYIHALANCRALNY